MLTALSIIDAVSCTPFGGFALQHDLQAALQVEALAKLAVPGRAGTQAAPRQRGARAR